MYIRMCLWVGHWKHKNAKHCQEDIYYIDTHDMCTFNLIKQWNTFSMKAMNFSNTEYNNYGSSNALHNKLFAKAGL